jgi:E3 ubiquitin-protein ligase RNF115/126
MAALGAPPGSLHAAQHHAGGAEAHFHGDHDHEGHTHALPAHPFLQLFSSLGMVGPGGNMGDFVYSQEGLDRIVSQLMEQTASSNAPPPAQPSDIENLPHKKVDDEMLGAEHKAECSICMDEVSLGEEVTVLPCKHWFHHQCVSAWLGEHDTCPHCRKSISKHNEQSHNPPSNTQSSSGPPINRTRSMPGAFDVSGSGTPGDPFVVPGDTGAATTGAQAEADSASNNNSMTDRIRRGLFGPQQ